MVALGLDLFRSRRTMVIGVCAGLLLMSIGYLSLYPSFEEQLESFTEDIPDAYKALVGDADIATPEGYIRSQVYSLLAPLLIAGAAISAGAGLARSERDQTLATFALTPIGRSRLFGSWWLQVAAVVSAAGLAAFVGVLIGGPLAGASVGVDRVLLATLPVVFFGLLLGSIALLVSTLTGAPGLATGVAWLTLLFSFIANSVAELIDALGWLSAVNPWSWHGAGEAITTDFNSGGLAALVCLSALVGVAAMRSFERRNLHL